MRQLQSFFKGDITLEKEELQRNLKLVLKILTWVSEPERNVFCYSPGDNYSPVGNPCLAQESPGLGESCQESS